ncbi:unnamed protein product [Allacma fusca]|uniref:C2H2-type domain-containing protein n=1 Tax=Allacma fusca TaxID=39272 RepID=A0A8J2KQL6_9HEXA|nr:unnamed protein product [Allacma fusca]
MFSTKYGITVHVDKCHVESSTSSRTERARMPTKVIHKENKFRDCKEVCIIERPHCCDICGESFKERYEVLKHKASTHLRSSSKQNNILCKVCGKKFVNLGLLIAHKTMYASGTCCRLQNEFICKICKMNFVSKALLCKHQLSHKDSRPFCCEFCRKTFKSKYAMRMHRAWTHLRNSHKKFACEICGEKFDRLLLLTLHDKVHEEAVVDEKIS